MRSRRDPQDVELETPPSSRRFERVGFRFAVIAALVRHERYPLPEAEELVRAWERYVRYAYLSEKSPESTAEHLARFNYYLWKSETERDPQRRGGVTVHTARGAGPLGTRRNVPREHVDEAIAADLRMRAADLMDEEPEHARLLLEEAQALSPRAGRGPVTPRDPQSRRRKKPAKRSAARGRPRPPEPIRGVGLNRLAPAGQRRISARGNEFRVCSRGTEIVSLIFPFAMSVVAAEIWARNHGFRFEDLEFPETTGTIRAPQRRSQDFVPGSFRTIMVSTKDDIRAVIGCPRKGRESDVSKGRSGRSRSGSRRQRRPRAA